jgi:hypothetical protein
MKIKAFFACEGTSRGPRKEWNLKAAGMLKITLKKPFTGVLTAEIPLFITLEREPNETEGPHKGVIKLFVDDEQPKRQEFDIAFQKDVTIASTVGSFKLPIRGSMSCRFELSLPGSSELMDWPLRIVALQSEGV